MSMRRESYDVVYPCLVIFSENEDCPMLKARTSLKAAWDSIYALKSGEKPLESHWTAAITALRAVGHVLAKEDGKMSSSARKIIDSHWNDWKQPDTIFSLFIDPTRNSLLKEWEGLPAMNIIVHDDFGEVIDVVVKLPDGGDGLASLEEAAHWLGEELDKIESEIEEANHKMS